MLDTKPHQYGSLTFEIPDASRVIEFNRGAGVFSQEIIFQVEEKKYSIKIAPAQIKGTAQQACQAVFNSASPLFRDEDLPPTQQGLAWRCKKRLLDGGIAPLVSDTAFVQDGAAIIQFRLACAHEQYPGVKPVFDHLLETMRPA